MIFYNNDQNLQKMKQFLCAPEKKIAIVVSLSGCGKSTFCQMSFSSFPQYVVVRPYYELFHSHKEFVQHIERHIQHKKNLLLFFDDVDVLFINNKSAQSYVSNLITAICKSNLDIKIVMTCTKHEEKKILDIRKKIDIIYLNPPTQEQCVEYIIRNELAPRSSKSELYKFVNLLGCNIQCIESNIRFHDICNESHGLGISLGMNIYEICHSLLDTRNILTEDAKNVYLSVDPTLITYTLYDNHRSFFECTYDVPIHQRINTYAYVSDFYVNTAVLESYFSNFLLRSISFDHNLLRLNSIQYAHRCLVQNCSERKRTTHKVTYTTINSRSSQHFNNLKKLQRFTSTYNLSRDNAFLVCELLHEKKRHTSKLFPELINIAHSYISNICTSNISPFTKSFKIMSAQP